MDYGEEESDEECEEECRAIKPNIRNFNENRRRDYLALSCDYNDDIDEIS